MWNPDTGSLREGVSLSSFFAAAQFAGVGLAPVANGITNSSSQAFANSLSVMMENQQAGRDVIAMSAYNPTTNGLIDGVETLFNKAGVDTASVAASRILIEMAVAHNVALADTSENPALAYTPVWGHSQGAAIVTQALMDESVHPDIRQQIDMRVFGSPVGAAPLGLNTYVNVGNANDPVSQVMGRQLSLSGGVENSRGFLEGNAANPDSYRSITTDFVVDAPAGQSNKNHSWQYYLADPLTRSGLGLVPLNDNLRGYYGRSQWKVGE